MEDDDQNKDKDQDQEEVQSLNEDSRSKKVNIKN